MPPSQYQLSLGARALGQLWSKRSWCDFSEAWGFLPPNSLCLPGIQGEVAFPWLTWCGLSV